LLERARKIASAYSIVIEVASGEIPQMHVPKSADGKAGKTDEVPGLTGFIGCSLELPHVFGEGHTVEECYASTVKMQELRPLKNLTDEFPVAILTIF